MEKIGGVNTKTSVNQEQIHDLLFNREIGWQEIIYDLINTEQLNPWDINILVLTDKYLEKIQKYEDADFFVSSKVLFAAALLLRIKSEILLSRYIKSIDEILFGKKEKNEIIVERIDFNDEIPELIPKSPMPRFRKVTLEELMESLNKAITTENRRIKREIINTNALREAGISLPRRKYSLKDKIKEIYNKLSEHFEKNKDNKKIPFTIFAGKEKEEKLITFSSLLHLDHQKKVWLEQEKHFEEIHIWLKEIYFKHNPDPFADLRQELEQIENINPKNKKLNKINKNLGS